MPAATPGAAPAPGSAPAPASGTGLVVAPFRGVRFNEAAVPDLAAVTTPPYDVVDPDAARRLEARHPYNVVRLILPRDEPDRAGARYGQAASTLRGWLEQHVLIRDDTPAIYVYDQHRERVHQRGLLAAVALRQPSERVVLPHEDVLPGPVADRLELMRATSANLEPILLVYDGGDEISRHLDVAAAQAPLIDATTDDGLRHRLWAITERGPLRAFARELAPKQALIADGHHRYATYLQLQAQHHRDGHGAGPWDYGLALLVDNTRYPLDLAAIARVVERLPYDDAVRLAQNGFASSTSCSSLASALRELEVTDGRNPLLVGDGTRFTLFSDPRPALLGGLAQPGGEGDTALDVAVLHEVVLGQLWQVSDASGRIRYVHDATAALRSARQTGGVAVLMRPVAVRDVVAAAARGERMPRKSTSFGPKPRTGFVLRLLDDEATEGAD